MADKERASSYQHFLLLFKWKYQKPWVLFPTPPPSAAQLSCGIPWSPWRTYLKEQGRTFWSSHSHYSPLFSVKEAIILWKLPPLFGKYHRLKDLMGEGGCSIWQLPTLGGSSERYTGRDTAQMLDLVAWQLSHRWRGPGRITPKYLTLTYWMFYTEGIWEKVYAWRTFWPSHKQVIKTSCEKCPP